MFHQLVNRAILALIFNFVLLFRINRPVSAISLSADTLVTIKKGHVYKHGYHRSAKYHQPYYYSLSSSVGLIRLSKLEQKIMVAVQQFSLNHLQENSQLKPSVKEYTEDYTATTVALANIQNVTQDKVKAAEVVAGNLIGAYRMARRFRNYIQPWMLLLSSRRNKSSWSQSELDFLTTITSLKSDSEKRGPYIRDFHFTMIAIILTQFQLEWKAQDIAKGTIKGMELGVTLGAVHCVEIGVHAVASLMYPIGIEWLQLALSKIQNGDDSMEPTSILTLLEKAKLKHDLNWKPQNGVNLGFTFYQGRLNESTYTKWQRHTQADPRRSTGENDLERSWDVCSGKLQKTDLEKSELFCWYETEVDPTWKIGPLKAELQSRFPLEILQFHDVLGENVIESVKGACEDKLEASASSTTDHELFPMSRFSETCYNFRDSPAHAQLRQLTQRITGMSSRRAENIQPSSYPPGGHIRTHIDTITGAKSYNDRLASLIYYFDGPKIGGETAFPFANVAIKTFKGSAIFWFNRLKSSEVDEDAVHLSCPVVQGQKWIGTNWMQYHHQTHWVCDPDQSSRAEYQMNGKSKYF